MQWRILFFANSKRFRIDLDVKAFYTYSFSMSNNEYDNIVTIVMWLLELLCGYDNVVILFSKLKNMCLSFLKWLHFSLKW